MKWYNFITNQSNSNLYWSESESHSVVSYSLYSPWNSPGQNTGVGSLSHLQGIFPTQGSNPGLLHYRQILYQLSHKGSPRILEWVAYPFSSRSSQPRNPTGVSCIAGGFFTYWVIRKPQKNGIATLKHSSAFSYDTKHTITIWQKFQSYTFIQDK